MICPYCRMKLNFCERTDTDDEGKYKLIYGCVTPKCRLDYMYLYMDSGE